MDWGGGRRRQGKVGEEDIKDLKNEMERMVVRHEMKGNVRRDAFEVIYIFKIYFYWIGIFLGYLLFWASHFFYLYYSFVILNSYIYAFTLKLCIF